MEAGQQERHPYRQLIFDNVIVRRSKVLVRNRETREWSLCSKRPIPQAGTFLGFYTGAMDRSDCPPNSLYSVDMGRGGPCIVPFPDERAITAPERERHAFANMNEPSVRDGVKEHANCHLSIQDFRHAEVENVHMIQGHERAVFFRGLAVFTCSSDIQRGDSLTWFYGASYQPHRDAIGYEPGLPCKRVLDNEVFIQDDSRSVLQSLRQVPHFCVYPVFSMNIKSARFKFKRKHREVGREDTDFSSGSGYEEAYKPRPSRRRGGANQSVSLDIGLATSVR
jgi:hypothetical protein